jgi:hypothetical protein
MTENDTSREQLEHPDRVVGPDGSRGDGRPTGTVEQPDAVEPESGKFPTVAPEEEGATPTTEHAPGADL